MRRQVQTTDFSERELVQEKCNAHFIRSPPEGSSAGLWCLPVVASREICLAKTRKRVWRSGGRLGIRLLRVLRRGLSIVRYTAVPLELGDSWNEWMGLCWRLSSRTWWETQQLWHSGEIKSWLLLNKTVELEWTDFPFTTRGHNMKRRSGFSHPLKVTNGSGGILRFRRDKSWSY